MPKLEEFSIGGSTQITREGLLALAKIKSLKVIKLGKMKNVAPADVDALRKLRPDVEITER
jgi:hypothetical protein